MMKYCITQLLVCIAFLSWSQQVQIIPPLVNMPGCSSISDLYSVGIQNFESESVEAAMNIEIRYTGESLQNGIIATGDLAGSPTFLLPPAFTQLSTANIDNFFPIRNLLITDPTLQALSTSSSCLPPGNYEVCIGLYAPGQNGQINLEDQISQTCFNRIKENTNNIFLISPFDGQVVNQDLPIFTWSPVSTFGPQGNYLLEIVEVLDFQTPFEAFRSNPLYYSQEGIQSNTVQYPISARAFDPCKQYAWRVGYYERIGFGTPGVTERINPSVSSELWSFSSICNSETIGDPIGLLTPDLIAPPSPQSYSFNSNLFFLWTEVIPIDKRGFTYQLKIYEENNSYEPVFTSNLSSDPYFNLNNYSEYLDREKVYLWGVGVYNEINQSVFPDDSYNYKVLSWEDNSMFREEDCPLHLGETTLVSNVFNEAKNYWELILRTPEDNENILSSELVEIEIAGTVQYVGPYISDLSLTTDLKNAKVDLVRSDKESTIIHITPLKSKIGGAYNLCLNKRYASGENSCTAQACVDLKLIEKEPDPCFITIESIPIVSTNYDADTDEFILVIDQPLLSNNDTEIQSVFVRVRGENIARFTNSPRTLSDGKLEFRVKPDDPTIMDFDWNFCFQVEYSYDKYQCIADSYCILQNFKRPMDDETTDHGGHGENEEECELIITRFEHKNAPNYWFVENEVHELYYGGNIQDYIYTEFLFDTQESPNRPDLYQRNQRVDFNVKSSSVNLQFDSLSAPGVTQKYAIVPDWGIIPKEERTLDNISFEIEACLSIDFNDINGNTVCTRTRCIDIHSHGSHDDVEGACLNENLLFQYTLSNEPNESDELAEGIWSSGTSYYQYDFLVDYQSSDCVIGNKLIHFEELGSQVNIEFLKLNGENEYAFYPDWGEAEFLGIDESILEFEVLACLSYDILDANNIQDSLVVDSRDTCLVISKLNNLDATPYDCEIEVSNFSVSLIKNPNEGFVSVDGVWSSGNAYYQYGINYYINNESQDCQIANEQVSFEELSSNSNIEFLELPNGNKQYAFYPDWDEAEFLGIDESTLEFEVLACLSFDVLDGTAIEDSIPIGFIDTCLIITKTAELDVDIEPSCQLLVSIDIEKDDNDVYNFYSVLENEDPNYNYTYTWEFSDGQSASGESTINLFNEPLEQTVTLSVTGIDINGSQCIVEATKSLNIRPGCDWQACDPSCSTILNRAIKGDDVIKLCGGLEVLVTNIERGNASNAKGQGTVRIPWLLSDIAVEFDGIKINSNLELCDGEVLAIEYDDAPNLPEALAVNVAYGLLEDQIVSINEYTNNRGIKHIPEDAMLDAAQDQVETLRVPIGFNNFDPSTGNGADQNNKTNYTLSIAAFRFTPGQNYLKAIAAVELNDEDIQFNGRLYFQSDHFFFNDSGPILSTGNSPDLGFEIIRPTTLQYGTNNGDPIHLIFQDDSKEDSWGGTSLKLTSECNQPYKFCLKADIDIEMPLSWFEPIEIDEDNPLEKVKANTKIEFCDFKDIITQISLPACHIANTSGLELEVEELTWDHSTTRNADNFAFPENYDETGIPDNAESFKGFFLKSARVLLPEDLSTYSDNRRLEAELNNWIIHKGYGISGKILAENLVQFPDMNVSDLGGSIDTFRFEMVNSTITEGYLKGEITLPICDYDEPGKPISKMDFKAMYASYPPNTVSSGLLFLITPQQTYDCPFFADGQLEIYETSNLYFSFTKDNSAVDFTLNGKLDFPNLEINAPVGDFSYELQMDANYENVNFNYTKPRGDEDGIVHFNHGVWSFASPQKKLNRFNFSIENFESVTEYNLQQGELFVGGIGFDAVVNLGKKIGGVAGLKILGKIEKQPGQRLRAGYRGLDVSKIGLYANLSAVKLDGEIEFLSDPVYVKAVKGSVSAEFKKVSSAIYAGVLFGNTTTDINPNGFRYMQVQAKAIWPDPGIPLFPGVGLRGVGAGFYNNMTATFDPASTNIDVEDSDLNVEEDSGDDIEDNPNAVWTGVTFTPAKDSLGFKLQFELASTPKEESFNGNLGFSGEINKSTGGLVRFGVDGNIWAGAKITERNKAFLTGSLDASYDFTTEIFDLNAEVNLDKESLEVDAGLKFNVNSQTNKYYLHFGTPNYPNFAKFLGVNSEFYLMFGNTNIYSPNGFFMEETVNGLNSVRPGFGTSAFESPGFAENPAIGLGKGFAAGLGINFEKSGGVELPLLNRTFVEYEINAGAEFNVSLLDYGDGALCSCCSYNPIGFNGSYLKANLAAYLIAAGYVTKYKTNGSIKWKNSIVDFRVGTYVLANFPRPWGVKGAMAGSIELLGGLVEADVEFDFQLGDYCSPSYNSPTETFEQEDASEDLFIFNQVLVDDGETNYAITKPIRWTSPYAPQERFSLPEQQADGSVIVRTFEVDFHPELWSKPTEEVRDDGSGVPPGWEVVVDEYGEGGMWGLDEIGRWALILGDDEAYTDREINVSMNTGNIFTGESTWSRKRLKGPKWHVGDFTGDGKDDLLRWANSSGGAEVLKSNGSSKFLDPNQWTAQVLLEGEDWIVGNFNGDSKDDIAFYRSGIGFFVLLSTGSSFSSPQIWTTESENGYGWLIGDFDGDGSDDLLRSKHESKFSPAKTELILSNESGFDTPIEWQVNVNSKLGQTTEGLNLFSDSYNPTPLNIIVFDIDDDGDDDLIINKKGKSTAGSIVGNAVIDLGVESDFNLEAYVSESNIFTLTEFEEEPLNYYPNQMLVESFASFNNDSKNDKFDYFPGTSHIEFDDVVSNSLSPNMNYKLRMVGKIKEIGGDFEMTEEITRYFSTDDSEPILTEEEITTSSEESPEGGDSNNPFLENEGPVNIILSTNPKRR